MNKQDHTAYSSQINCMIAIAPEKYLQIFQLQQKSLKSYKPFELCIRHIFHRFPNIRICEHFPAMLKINFVYHKLISNG